ncbi:MAG: PAS domain S-box protein [Candidatus Lokiarchaeota archaeon]|nr:PAS domain S-box protein [Candidatus Lokiarchaeota archaeon]
MKPNSSLLANLPDDFPFAIIRVNLTGIIISCTLNVEKFFGFTSEKLIGQHIDNIFLDGHESKVFQCFHFMLGEEKYVGNIDSSNDIACITPEGTKKFYVNFHYVDETEKETIEFVFRELSPIEEITWTHKEPLTELFIQAAKLNPNPVQLFDREGHSIWVNTAFIEAHKLAPPKDLSFIDSGYFEEIGILPFFDRALNGKVTVMPPRWVNPIQVDGKFQDAPLCFESTFIPLTNSEGTVEYVLIHHENVTEEILVREKLERNQQKFQKLYEFTEWLFDLFQNNKEELIMELLAEMKQVITNVEDIVKSRKEYKQFLTLQEQKQALLSRDQIEVVQALLGTPVTILIEFARNFPATLNVSQLKEKISKPKSTVSTNISKLEKMDCIQEIITDLSITDARTRNYRLATFGYHSLAYVHKQLTEYLENIHEQTDHSADDIFLPSP